MAKHGTQNPTTPNWKTVSNAMLKKDVNIQQEIPLHKNHKTYSNQLSNCKNPGPITDDQN